MICNPPGHARIMEGKGWGHSNGAPQRFAEKPHRAPSKPAITRPGPSVRGAV